MANGFVGNQTFLTPARRNRQHLLTDLKAYEAGNLAPTEAEMAKAADAGAQGTRQAIAAQNANLMRGGVSPEQAAQLAQQGQQAVMQGAAASRANAHNVGLALAEARRQELLTRLSEAHDRARQNRQFAATTATQLISDTKDRGKEGAGALLKLATGGVL